MIVASQNFAQVTGEITGTYNGPSIPITSALTFSAQVNATIDTPAAKTFLSGVAALLAVQDLTYTAVLRGVAGNSITIAYTGGGTAGAEVVTVVGTAISVQIQSGTSTGTQVRTAINAAAAATALISCAVTGTGSNAQTTASATPLATGVDSKVNVAADTVTITAQPYATGDKVQLITNGTLPAGLSLSTDYFIIVVDANTIKFATSLALAIAGTAVDITDQGSSGATNTITATSLAGATVVMQKSNDGSVWTSDGSPSSISSSSTVWLEKVNPTGIFMRLQYVLTAGQMNCTSYIAVKGPS